MSLSHRLPAIDAARGLIMVLMLMDHCRETFYLHQNVSDPLDITNTETALFITRLVTHLCAPLFVFLSGLSAWLYAQRYADQPQALTRYLLTRGALLLVLEVTLINFSWVLATPKVIYLQVIWAIGISMLALTLLAKMPTRMQLVLGVAIVAGHNLLDGWHLPQAHALHWLWAVLHERAMLPLTNSLSVRTSYPVLPWIGIMLLGYVSGRYYLREPSIRQAWLLKIALLCLVAFVLLRWINVYGDLHSRVVYDAWAMTLKSFFNVTKYPPSLLFVLLTLGIGLLVLRYMQALVYSTKWYRLMLQWLTTFGRVPLFFYVVHLYLLHGVYALVIAVIGPNQGALLGLPMFWPVWLLTLVSAILLYWPCLRYAELKHRYPNSFLRFL